MGLQHSTLQTLTLPLIATAELTHFIILACTIGRILVLCTRQNERLRT